jgi:uncharacterized cupredoxin-like copper-binding protein
MYRLRVPSAVVVVGVVLLGCRLAEGPVSPPPIVEPGTAERPREVNLIARDYSFEPAELDLVPGETILLHVVNAGLDVHEAVVGDAAVQGAWEAAEARAIAPPGQTPVVTVPEDVAGLRVVVASGQRVDVTYTVPPSTGGLLVGCHIPGHFAKGMVIPVRLVEKSDQPAARG